MKRLLVVLTILSFAFGLFNPQTTLASTPLPREDYEKLTKNQQFDLVMLVTAVGTGYNDKPNEYLRAKYASSGLYKNDGSTQPLWTIDWWEYPSDIFVSSDGKHLVRLNYDMTAVGPDALHYKAVSFYENGNLLKSYQYSDLITNPDNLPHPQYNGSLSYSWLKDYKFDDSSNRFTLSTQFGESYKFDVTNGNKVFFLFDLNIPWPFWVLIALLLIGMIGAFFDIKDGKRYAEQVIIVRRK